MLFIIFWWCAYNPYIYEKKKQCNWEHYKTVFVRVSIDYVYLLSQPGSSHFHGMRIWLWFPCNFALKSCYFYLGISESYDKTNLQQLLSSCAEDCGLRLPPGVVDKMADRFLRDAGDGVTITQEQLEHEVQDHTEDTWWENDESIYFYIVTVCFNFNLQSMKLWQFHPLS